MNLPADQTYSLISRFNTDDLMQFTYSVSDSKELPFS